MKNFFKVLLGIIKTIAVVFILLIVSVTLVQRAFNNKVSIGGYRMFTIITESMVPVYNVYDVIISKTVNPSTIKVNDIVVYQGEVNDFADKIVTHRVFSINQTNPYKFTTKGDANDVVDPEISEEQIYGKVIMKSTVLSFISKLVNNTFGFYFLILVPLAFLIALEIIDFVNERKEKELNVQE